MWGNYKTILSCFCLSAMKSIPQANFAADFELEQIEDSCKAASNEMGESAFIELVDYSGNYKYFK